MFYGPQDSPRPALWTSIIAQGMNRAAQEVQMKLLQIDSSARAGSVTRRLTAKFAEEWRRNHPTGEVIHRDLSTTMLPLITDELERNTNRTL
jgi:hypothetical protein